MRWYQLAPDALEKRPATVTIVESLFYDIGGRMGVCAIWGFGAVTLLAIAWALRRAGGVSADAAVDHER